MLGKSEMLVKGNNNMVLPLVLIYAPFMALTPWFDNWECRLTIYIYMKEKELYVCRGGKRDIYETIKIS